MVGITLLCAAFYGLMGMSAFGGSLRRRCVLTDGPDTAVGPARYCSPLHRMPFNSRNEGSKCVG